VDASDVLTVGTRHVLTFGGNFRRNSRFLGNMAVSYTGEAYWQDVLDARYAGTTKPTRS